MNAASAAMSNPSLFSMFAPTFAMPDLFGVIVAPCIATCAIVGLCHAGFNLREYRFVKSALWALGVDKYEDFVLFVVVHGVTFSTKEPKYGMTSLRLTAGGQQVATNASSNGQHEQPLSLFVEQGTQIVVVELLDIQHKVLATLKLAVEQDIINSPEVQEKAYTMRQKKKNVTNPRMVLSFRQDYGDEEAGLGQEANSLYDESSLSEMEKAVRACAGPLKILGEHGGEESVYVAAGGPPKHKRYSMGIWENQFNFQKGKEAKRGIEVMKITSVMSHPEDADVFEVCFLADKVRQSITFKRMDRPRDTWVELLVDLVGKVREERDSSKSVKRRSLG